MKSLYSRSVFAAAIVAVHMAAFTSTTAAQQTAPEQQVTITGCVQSESDYRRARDAGRGGVAGTGVGAGNEYVLINASMAPGAGAAPTTGAAGATPTGTAGAATTGAAYELTGSSEGQAAKHVGKRVEISGRLKAAEVQSAGRPTGGATAGKPPEGVDIGGQDLKLRELEVTSIREVAGTCPAS